MVRQLHQLENMPEKKGLVPHKNDKHSNSLGCSKMKSEAFMSVPKMSVDGPYYIEVMGGSWLPKRQMQRCTPHINTPPAPTAPTSQVTVP